MLSTISWGRFGSVILSLTALYYLAICVIFYHKAISRWLKFKIGLVVAGVFVVRSGFFDAD